jgi:hypothetical protein
MDRRRLALALLTTVGLAFAACSEDGTEDSPTSESSAVGRAPAVTVTAGPVTPSGPQFGTAGLIPRNFPNAEADDWIAMYEASADAGTLLGVYGQWFDDNTAPGDIPEVFRGGYAGVRDIGGFTPVIAVGFASEDILSGVMQPTLDWSDPEDVAHFSSVVTGIAEQYQPPFFILGAEINRIWEQHPAAYEAFIAQWPAVYDVIKTASPDTQVGTSFQYEFLRGEGFLSGQQREPQWQLLDPFVQVGDFIGLSTYPFFDYETPDAIPADYYAEVAERTGLPLAFTEMGWPSRPLSTFPESGYGGSEAEQAAFAERFLELIGGVEVRFALWSFQHDVGAPGGPAFESVALRENDGTPKPALEVWRVASE